MHQISCTVKDESSLFFTVSLKSWGSVHIARPENRLKGCSPSSLSLWFRCLYWKSPEIREPLSKISIEPSSCLLKLHWHSREAGLLMWTPKGHTKSPQCYSFHRVIMDHPGFAGLGSNNFKYKGFKMTLLKFTWMTTTLLPDRGKLKQTSGIDTCFYL